MKLTLPYPPSANLYWRSYRGMVVVSREASNYKLMVKLRCTMAGYVPHQGAVAVTVRLYRPRRSGDLDNRLKVLLDSLNGGAWKDDSQVVELHAYRYDDAKNPRVEVEIEEATE